MRIEKVDGTFIDLKVLSYATKQDINYKLTLLSNKSIRSVDRGPDTDVYTSEVTIVGDKDYIYELTRVFMDLRKAKQLIKITNVEESIFGVNIRTDYEYACYVDNIGKIEMTDLRVGQMKFTLRLVNPLFKSNNPLNIYNCLDWKYKAYNEFNTHLQGAYNSSFIWQVDREVDTYIFEGVYVLQHQEIVDLLEHRRTKRGNTFNVIPSYWGLPDKHMFGPNLNETSYDVVWKDLKITDVGPVTAKATVSFLLNMPDLI